MTSAKYIPSKINNSAGYTAKRMTSKLRSSAYRSGWPPQVTRQLTVRHDGGDQFYVDYPKKIEKAVLELEQGNQHTPPNAAILRFMNRSHPHLEDYVTMVFAGIMDMEIFK